MTFIPGISLLEITAHDQNHESIISPESDLQRCPLNVMETIFSYLDGQALLTFRLVQKMSPEQEQRYSRLLNQFFQFKLTSTNSYFPSPSRIMRWIQYAAEVTGLAEKSCFPLFDSPIFSAFDTVHLPISLQTLSHLNKIAQLFGDQGRSLKGLNFIRLSWSLTEHFNPLIKTIVSTENEHPIAKILPNLEHLYLRTDRPIDQLTALLGQISHLKTLALYCYLPLNNFLASSPDDDLRRYFHALTRIDIPNSEISAAMLRRLFDTLQTPLESLDLFGCTQINGLCDSYNKAQIAAIFRSIENLELGLTNITGRNLATILSGCESLRELSLAGNATIRGFLYFLTEEESDRMLQLSLNNLSKMSNAMKAGEPYQSDDEDILQKIKTEKRQKLQTIFGSIHTLDLSLTVLSSDDFYHLFRSCKSLRNLNLRACSEEISVAICKLSDKKMKDTFEKINSLNLERALITAPALARLIQSCRSLQKLNLSHCTNLTEAINLIHPEDLESIFSSVSKLTLDSTEIQTPELQKILEACQTLTTLSLSSCKDISALIESNEVPEIFGHLETLDLGCTNASASALVKLLPACHSLKTLSLMFCESASEAISLLSLESLTEIFAPIQSIKLNFTKLTADAKTKLIKAAPHLKNKIEKDLKWGKSH